MRKRFQRIGYVVFVVIVVMSFMGCSLINPSKPIEKPKPEKSVEKKPEKARPKPEKPEPKKSDVQSIIQEGKAYHEKGELKKAIASFEQALKLEPGNTDAATQLQATQDELKASVDSHLKQGIKYFNQENLEDAMTEWKKVLELDPTNKDALDYKEKTQKRLDALGNK